MKTPATKATQETLTLFINERSDLPNTKVGEPALYWEPSMKLFVEPTKYLHDEYCSTAASASPHTWLAVGHCLVLWFDYLLAGEVLNWRLADSDDLKEYLRDLSSKHSPKTHKPYAQGTIRNRILPVIGFYCYSKNQEWYQGDLALDESTNRRPGKSIRSSRLHKLAPKAHRNKAKIRPFSTEEYKTFACVVGPRPSERTKEDQRPARDRLITDIGFFVGARVEEIERLTRHQFQSLVPDPGAPNVHYPITIRGKGSKGSGPRERPVAFPAWLIIEINMYIEGERAEAIRAGKIDDHGILFVSGIGSNLPGRPMTKRRYEQIVEEGCLKAGLVETENRVDAVTGEHYDVKHSRHCFHDLRHTYATWRYWVETERGNSEPWKGIQAQLGPQQA